MAPARINKLFPETEARLPIYLRSSHSHRRRHRYLECGDPAIGPYDIASAAGSGPLLRACPMQRRALTQCRLTLRTTAVVHFGFNEQIEQSFLLAL